MRFGNTIGRDSLRGMLLVSWASIVLLGVAWGTSLYVEFQQEAASLRQTHFEKRKGMVKAQVDKAVATVQTMRRLRLDELEAALQDSAARAARLAQALRASTAAGDRVILENVAKTLSADADGEPDMTFVDGRIVFSIHSLSGMREDAFVKEQLRTGFASASGGSRRIAVALTPGGKECTLSAVVKRVESPVATVVLGACLEGIEEQVKNEVADRLSAVSFGEDGYLFGGTWQGVSKIGPVRGVDMWRVVDVEGTPVVQELVEAAKRGGGYVEYVMPQFDGRENTKKISYARPIRDWKWYVGGSLYMDDVERLVRENQARLQKEIVYELGLVGACLAFLSLFALSASRRLSNRVQANVRTFTDVWNRASSTGVLVDPDSLQYQEFKELALSANRMAEDRKRVESAVAESADRFRILVSNLPGVVYHCAMDKDWTMEFISDRVEKLTGYPARDFIGNEVRSFASVIDPEDRQWLEHAVAEDVRAGRHFSLEYRIIRSDGETRWVFERGVARHDDAGVPQWLDGVIFDVTERKRTEDEHYNHLHFLETMERLDRALHGAADLETGLEDAMEAVRQAFGADRSWLMHPCDPKAQSFAIRIERTVSDLPRTATFGTDMPMRSGVAEMFRVALADPAPVAYDPASGRETPKELAQPLGVQSQLITALRPGVGAPWLLGLHQCAATRIWSGEDMRLFTEVGRRIADALGRLVMFRKLQESEDRFRTFSEQTMLGVAVLQGNRYVFANRAYADIFEMTPQEVERMDFEAILGTVHPDDRDFVAEQARKKQADEADVKPSYRWRAVTKTGRLRWVEVHSKTVTLGGAPAVLISLMDVTDRKRSEDELERIIAERTDALERRTHELQDANERLVKLDQLKSAFLSTVSHDLRTPLTSVLGFSKLVRRDLDRNLDDLVECDAAQFNGRERIVRNLDVIEAEGDRLTRIIDEYFDLQAMESGAAQWFDEVVRTENCLRRSVKRAEALLEARPNVALTLDIDGRLPKMTVDPQRLEQVFDQLLENAIRFTRSGEISVRAHSPDGQALAATVTDTGKGVPEGELAAIFEPFHQVDMGDTLPDDALPGETRGTGLGLALCRRIVERYGGSVGVRSDLGRGSTFTVMLPGDPQV